MHEALSAARESSRDSRAGAGWQCAPGSYRQLVDESPLPPGRRRSFAWLNPAPLWASRNDRIARMLGDPTGNLRQKWLERLPGGNPDRIVEVAGAPNGSISFLLMGHTGEGDASQFAVVPPLETGSV